MDLYEAHKRVLLKINKEINGYSSFAETDRALDIAQMELFNQLRPVLGSQQTVHEWLFPFKKRFTFNDQNYDSGVNDYGTGPDGVLVLPTDYEHFNAIRQINGSFTTFASYSMSTTPTGTIATAMVAGETYRIRVSFDSGSSTAFTISYGSQVLLPAQDVNGTVTITFVPTTSNANITYTSSDTGSIVATILTSLGELQPFEIVPEDKVAQRLASAIAPVTASDPIANMDQVGGVINSDNVGTQRRIQLFPEQGFNGVLMYLKRPATPNFVYTQSERTITYNAAGSTQMEWSDGAMREVIDRAARILAANIEDQTAYTEAKAQGA